VLAIARDLTDFCAPTDDCDVAERPADHPGRKASGETRAFIDARRRQAKALGEDLIWDVGYRRFMTVPENDVRLVIGGHFGADHIGPELHNAVLERIRARPKLYLGVVVRVAAASTPVFLSSSYMPSFVSIAREHDAASARSAATELLPIFRKALAEIGGRPGTNPVHPEGLREKIGELERIILR
jgi:hypothetical protein